MVHIGCYAETPDHTAIPLLKRLDNSMDFTDCFNLMFDKGCPIFTFIIEGNNRKCYAAKTLDTYAQNGPSTKCLDSIYNVWPQDKVEAIEVFQLKGNLIKFKCSTHRGLIGVLMDSPWMTCVFQHRHYCHLFS